MRRAGVRAGPELSEHELRGRWRCLADPPGGIAEFGVDGKLERVGGLVGQPNWAFLLLEPLDLMTQGPAAIAAPAQVSGGRRHACG
ncbi:MAG: hypothetical protein CMJ88_08920 [Planctomycetes bacterium]|nr:hypothetical protein [Planctomycetota bacterium]